MEHLGLLTYYLTAYDFDARVAFINLGMLKLKTNWQNGSLAAYPKRPANAAGAKSKMRCY